MQALKIVVGGETLVLHGPGKHSLIRGCLRRPAVESSADQVREQLDLILEGGRADTQAFLQHLQQLLTRVSAGVRGDLLICPAEGDPIYQSRLTGGVLTWLVGSVQPRGMGLRLELVRETNWYLPWQSLPLSNGYGSQQTDPLRIDNRADGLGENFILFTGEIPEDGLTPLRIKLTNSENGVPLSGIYAGLSRRPAPLFTLEGEDAQANPVNGVILNADCSNGAYQQVPLTRQAGSLLTWVVDETAWSGLAGQCLFPVARLALPAPADLWLWWKVFYGEIGFESTQYSAGDGLVFPLPRLVLPNPPEDFPPGGPLVLELWGQLTEAETGSLSLDAVTMVGGEGWLTGELDLNAGACVVIEPEQERIIFVDPNGRSVGEVRQVFSDGMALLPGQPGCLSFVFAGGDSETVSASLAVQAWIRPCVRVLP